MTVTTKNPTAAVDDSSVGTLAWTNPGNATGACDSVDATAVAAGALQTHNIYMDAFAFGVPTNGLISDISLTLKIKGTVTTAYNISGRVLRKSLAGASGTGQSDGTFRPPSTGVYETITINGSLAFWGVGAWTIAEINAMGVALNLLAGAANTMSLDCCTVAITYSVPGLIHRGLMRVGFIERMREWLRPNGRAKLLPEQPRWNRGGIRWQ